MTCRRVRALAPAYLDGELAGPWADELEAHVEGCAQCRQRIADLRAAMAALAAARPEEHVPEPDTADLHARIAASAARVTLRRAWAVAGVTTAAVAAVSALWVPRRGSRVVRTVVRGPVERWADVTQERQAPRVDDHRTKIDEMAKQHTPGRAIRRSPGRGRPTTDTVAEIPEPVRMASRALAAALIAAVLSGGEGDIEVEPTVAVVMAWDDVVPEEVWNVPETSSYSAAVTLPNGDRNTLATETHPADPEAPIMVAATYEPHL